jgi:hypothetical protein
VNLASKYSKSGNKVTRSLLNKINRGPKRFCADFKINGKVAENEERRF